MTGLADGMEAALTSRLVGPRTVEIGCGSNPTPGVWITVDIRPPGIEGEGSEEGRHSMAGVCASMDALPFRDGVFHALVARHVLEHHDDTLSVLREWTRIAERLVIVCPDQANFEGNTVALDPTHRACFTPSQLARLVEHARNAWVSTRPAITGWSFLLVADPEN